MKISNILLFFITVTMLWGVYYLVDIKIKLKAYKLFKIDEESFLDYCYREYNDWAWYLRKKLNWRLFYNSRLFVIFQRLKGIILVLISLILLAVYLYLYFTEYRVFLYEKI